MKKTVLILTAIAVMFGVIFGSSGFASAAVSEITTSAKSAYLMDFDTGTVIYKQNENEKLQIASMVKIMTSLLCFEAINRGEFKLTDEIEVSPESAAMGGSQIFLDAHTKHKASDLIKSIVVASANDSAHVMAEKIGGSEAGFVKMMNKRAKELGMENTLFSNCTGLPAMNQYSTAKDVSIMLRSLLSHNLYYEFCGIWLEDYQHPDGRVTTMTNTNKLIRFYKGCDSGKTGFTAEAKFCLSASAKRNDMRVIATVIGEPDSKTRFKDISDMFNYAFGAYENRVLYPANQPLEQRIEVKNGRKPCIELIPEKNISAFTKRGDEGAIEVNFELPNIVSAPIQKGDVVGKAVIIKGGKVIAEVNILANETVEKARLSDIIKRITENW